VELLSVIQIKESVLLAFTKVSEIVDEPLLIEPRGGNESPRRGIHMDGHIGAHGMPGESGRDLYSVILPLSKEDVAAIESGMDRYAVLIFRDQRLSDDEQIAFTKNFGQIESAQGGNITKDHERRLKDGMIDVSNLDQNGQPIDRNDRRRMFNLGNRLWHSDSSYRTIPAKYSILSARVVAARGGQYRIRRHAGGLRRTRGGMLAMIGDLICEYSLTYSRGAMGFTELTEVERATFRPVRQRLVRTHPVTGRKSPFLSSHIGSVVGWPLPEGRDLIRDLIEHAIQREFVHAHVWQQYDLVIWDNRQTMQRVRRFDESQPRDMRRTTVAGEAMTVAQVRLIV
jgi:alpha-ketoglutarate-dependent 2,4-dichlorophenoxyacetate dioxygenase